MNVQFARWGNSLAVRIPSILVNEVGAVEGLSAEIAVRDGCIILKPIKQRKVYRLEDLLAGITPTNLHSETSTGHETGAEKIE
jgi:antitoxin component of MazEF toxin-antitoxin module